MVRNLFHRPLIHLQACLMLLLGVGAAAGPTVSRVPDLKLEIDGPEASAALVRDVAAECARHLARILASDPEPDRPLHIRIAEHLPASPDPLVLHFSPGLPLPTATHAVALALLTRRAQMLQGAARGPIGSLDWLASAVTYRVLTREPPALGADVQIRTFPISPGGRLPDLNRIIANPIPPDAGIAYTLFARYCELVIGLLQAGDAGGSDRLNRIFALQATGKAPAAALEMVAGDLQKPGETVQDWLEREYAQQARQKHLYADTDALAARLRELESLPMVGTGEKGTFGVARITLDQLVANGHGYKFSAGDYAALYRSYFTLSRDAPPLLQPAIQEYILALEALRAGKTRPFRQHFQKGRETFATGVAKQKALTEYLDELERNTSRPASTLRTILGPLIDQSRERRDALDPPLREYLRKVD